MKIPFLSLLIALGATVASAQPATQPDEKADKVFSLTGGFDVQSKYIFRGYLTTNSGFIGQPYAQLDYKAFSNDEWTISPYAGTWMNVTSHPLGGADDYRWLSETDANAGINIVHGDFTLGLHFTYYGYPNASLKEDYEAGVSLAYDDSKLWKDNPVIQGLNPKVSYYHEIQNRGGPEGGYIELSLEPTLQPINVANVPITVSFPLIAGLTHDLYYLDSQGNSETFGYFLAGVKASIPLEFLNKGGGDWNLVMEADYWLLNAANIRELDGGKSSDVTFRVGVTFEF
jgi:hypothetical protein